jgi:hypothetical protein
LKGEQMLIHREALALANNALDESDGKYCLNFVKVEKDGTVIAVDGHHFLRMKAKVDEPSLLDAMLPDEHRDNSEDALIPADVLTSFAAAINKMDDNAHVVISTKDEHITLCSTDGICERTFIAKPPALPFPDVNRVMQKRPAVSVVLDLDLLGKIVRTLKKCGASSVTLGVKDAESQVGLSAWTDSGPIDGAIMPMRKG